MTLQPKQEHKAALAMDCLDRMPDPDDRRAVEYGLGLLLEGRLTKHGRDPLTDSDTAYTLDGVMNRVRVHLTPSERASLGL